MAPSCVVDPMDCIFEKRSVTTLYKRAPTTPDHGSSPSASPDSANKVPVIIGATVGSLLLIFSLGLFYCCMRRRRASRRIGQLQQFLPTFMDKDQTEKYFQRHSSSSTLVVAPSASEKDKLDPSQPSNVHHRTRSVPVAFAKGVTDHRNRELEREGSMGQFQQISLTSEETILVKDEATPRRSLSGGSARARSSTVTAPAPAVVSALHRSVSLNKHNSLRPSNGRSGPMEEEEERENTDKFADGESLVAPNRFSALLDFDSMPDFDPTRFSTASVMFDAKRLSNMSTASSDESMSTSSSDEFNSSLPPHQKQHSFHSHHNSPTMQSREISADVSATMTPNHPSYYGEKQELEDDDELQFAHMTQFQQQVGHSYQKQEFYPPLQQASAMPMPMPTQMPMPTHSNNMNMQANRGLPMPMTMTMPMPMPSAISSEQVKRTGVPLPPSIRLSRPHGGQEMSLAVHDQELDGDSSN
ncbi:hypothetical protein BGZ75_006603 [Mortierella antarctica]|nr:hypothetical protein BGZ75_006603 [Mortierella antarctica]